MSRTSKEAARLPTIVGPDPGKFKGVARACDADAAATRSAAVPAGPGALRKPPDAGRPGLVSPGAGPIAGRVAGPHDRPPRAHRTGAGRDQA
ncbi:MAG: hypothetical protein U0800_06505 [Isosphaeraceae bacterium]